jgi:polysaccharide export outer membrane protein
MSSHFKVSWVYYTNMFQVKIKEFFMLVCITPKRCLPFILALELCSCQKDIIDLKATPLSDKGNIPIYHIDSKIIFENNAFYQKKQFLTDNTAKKLESSYRYVIKTGDKLNITIWGHPNLNNPNILTVVSRRPDQNTRNNTVVTSKSGTVFTVNDLGDIDYPYIGRVHLSGRTIPNAAYLLKQKIKRYIKNPSLNLDVFEYANAHVNVLGAVNKPQRIPLTNVSLNLADAIATAGGESREGNVRNVELKRDNHIYHLDLLAKSNARGYEINLHPGDLVYVNRYYQTRIYVLGELMKPNVVWLQDDHASITEALATAEGLNIPRAKQDVYVIRVENDKFPKAYYVNMGKPAGLLLASNFKLRPNDVVYVGTRDLTAWNDVVSQLLPTAMTIEFSTRAVNDLTRSIRDIQNLN